jgi:hypothetical protein
VGMLQQAKNIFFCRKKYWQSEMSYISNVHSPQLKASLCSVLDTRFKKMSNIRVSLKIYKNYL